MTQRMPPMPPHVRDRVERRLDRIARELLAEELDVDDAVAMPARPSGSDSDRRDRVGDQAPPLRKPPRGR